ncbi:MAG: BglII/BstYI family type II restriction endonuclease [Gemmobacter sp.]
MFSTLRDRGFDIETRNHAEAILSVDFPAETAELVAALQSFSITTTEIIGSGGGEAKSTQRLRRVLSEAGWDKHNFRIQTTVDGQPLGSGTSHQIDHVRRGAAGVLALEIEWNNKDPFFDRDLENFQRLHAQSVISLGIVVTRGQTMQAALGGLVEDFLRLRGIGDEAALREFGMKDRTERQRRSVARAMGAGLGFAAAFARQFTADKYGMATTHWNKLTERTARGVGNPCPLLLIGLPLSAVAADSPAYSAASPEL